MGKIWLFLKAFMIEKGGIQLRTNRLLLVLLLCLGLFLVACNGEEEEPEERKNYTVEDRTVTETRLVVYEGPNLLQTSSKLSVKVEDEELFVYETRVNHNRLFSFSEPKTTAPVVLLISRARSIWKSRSTRERCTMSSSAPCFMTSNRFWKETRSASASVIRVTMSWNMRTGTAIWKSSTSLRIHWKRNRSTPRIFPRTCSTSGREFMQPGRYPWKAG